MIAGNRAVRFGSFGVRFCSVGMLAAVWFSLVARLQAATPPLREQVSLNGQWLYAPRGAAPTTRNVPGENGDLQEAANDSGSHFKGFGFDGTDSAWYERSAVVPAAWAGKRIMFESDYVGHVVEVYVGDRLAGTHVGMALPFRIEVTELVTPGAEVRIRVRVWDRSKEPVHVGENSSGAPRYFWPNASWDNGCQWYGDVWLRAYGQVHLAETFIQTSWRHPRVAGQSPSQAAVVRLGAIDAMNRCLPPLDDWDYVRHRRRWQWERASSRWGRWLELLLGTRGARGHPNRPD